MKLQRKIVDYGFVALLLLCPTLLLRSGLKSPDQHNRFDEALLRISAPLQATAGWILGGIGGTWRDYVWLVDVEKENDTLRNANRRLRTELIQLRQIEAQVRSLEDLLELKQRTKAETAAGHVIATSLNSSFRVNRIRIDSNASQVNVGMSVINGQGLVGRVSATYGGYSDVRLLSDPLSEIEVVVPSTGGRGMLRGIAKSHAYECEIGLLEGKVQVGDEILTTGLGPFFSAGIKVGEIVSVQAQEGLFQRVRVKPAVDFSRLDAVLILLAAPPPDDPNADTIAPSQRAHALKPF